MNDERRYYFILNSCYQLSEVKDPPSSWPVLQALTKTEADSYLSKPEDEKQLVLIVSEEVCLLLSLLKYYSHTISVIIT